MVQVLPFLVLKMRQLKIRTQITNRQESTSFEKYLNDVAKCELLEIDGEVAAFKELELLNPDHKKLPDQFNEFDPVTKKKIEKVVEKISKANLRFVVSVAKQYQNYKVPLPDLVNDWNLWLVKAIYRFDYTRWFKFISYAVWWIRQSILQSIAENTTIRIPMNQNSRINEAQKIASKIEQVEGGRTLSDEEIKEKLNLSDTEFWNFLDAVFAKRVTSLDKKINDDDDDNLQSVIPDINSESPDYDIEQRSTTEAILSALDTSLKKPSDPWKPDPKEIIRLYFYEGKTLEEIAERFDISRERVRQIRDRALKSLKHNKTLQDLHDTLNE